MAIKYKGRFQIVGKNPNAVTYIVKNLDKETEVFQVHHDRLKLFHGHFREFVDKKYAKENQVVVKKAKKVSNQKETVAKSKARKTIRKAENKVTVKNKRGRPRKQTNEKTETPKASHKVVVKRVRQIATRRSSRRSGKPK